MNLEVPSIRRMYSNQPERSARLKPLVSCWPVYYVGVRTFRINGDAVNLEIDKFVDVCDGVSLLLNVPRKRRVSRHELRSFCF